MEPFSIILMVILVAIVLALFGMLYLVWQDNKQLVRDYQLRSEQSMATITDLTNRNAKTQEKTNDVLNLMATAITEIRGTVNQEYQHSLNEYANFGRRLELFTAESSRRFETFETEDSRRYDALVNRVEVLTAQVEQQRTTFRQDLMDLERASRTRFDAILGKLDDLITHRQPVPVNESEEVTA